MSGQDGEIRALRQLVREIEQQPTPELDWEQLEQRLFAEVDRERPAPGNLGSWRWKVAGVAAAATVVFGAGLGAMRTLDSAQAPDPTSHAPANDPSGPIDGDRLAVGRRIVAGTEPVVVEHVGRSSWTLQPHGNAWLARAGQQLTIRLEFGSIVASVVPSELAESFAVEVGQTRIAVHGTVFRVEHLGDHTHVEVQQGTVSVRSIDGRDQGWLLSAPATGRFSLNGRRLDTHELKPRQSAAAQGPRRPPEPAPAEAAEPSAGAAGLDPRPTQAELELAADKVGDVVRRCFAQTTNASGGVHVSASSIMTVHFGSAGKVSRLEFDPPLSPPAHACSEAGVSAIRVVPSRQGAFVSRHVHLG